MGIWDASALWSIQTSQSCLHKAQKYAIKGSLYSDVGVSDRCDD